MNQNAKLHLATIFNRIDLAQRFLEDETTFTVNDVKEPLLFWTLRNNHTEFIKLFLKKGLSLHSFLTVQKLEDLYNRVEKDTLLYELLEEKRENDTDQDHKSFNLKHVGSVIDDLTAWSYKPLYLRDKFTDDDDRFEKPTRELFIWAILQGRLGLAVLFWRKCKAPIGGALVAGMILKNLEEREQNTHSNRITRYSEGERYFKLLAVQVLSECYQSNRTLTVFTLDRKLQQWGSSNYIDLAQNAKNMDFIAHLAVQNLLQEYWMGKISKANGELKLWACFVLPFATHLLKLKEEEADAIIVKKLPRGKSKGDIIVRPKNNRRTRRVAPVDQPGSSNNTEPTRTQSNQQKEESAQGSFVQRFQAFHTAPFIIFRYNLISTVIFLGLFSYILLRGFTTEHPSNEEYILIGWFGTMCTETIRQILFEDGPTLWYKVNIWGRNFWNIIDIAKTTIFITGYMLRGFDMTLSESRILLSIALILFYIRLLSIFSANKHTGPKLVMIQKMLADMFVFLGFFGVFMAAYGVTREAIHYPGRVGINAVLRNIFYGPYLQIFGELLDTDEEETDKCEEYIIGYGNSTHPEPVTACRRHDWYGLVVLAIYLAVCNILLLNLLIAMFNFTFTAVQERTTTFYRWQRYKMIKEYYKRPVLPPPFIIINHVLLFIIKMMRVCTCIPPKRRNDNKISLQDKHPLSIWESLRGEDYLAKNPDILKKMQTSDNKFEEIWEISSQMATFNEQLKNMQLLIADIAAERSDARRLNCGRRSKTISSRGGEGEQEEKEEEEEGKRKGKERGKGRKEEKKASKDKKGVGEREGVRREEKRQNLVEETTGNT